MGGVGAVEVTDPHAESGHPDLVLPPGLYAKVDGVIPASGSRPAVGRAVVEGDVGVGTPGLGEVDVGDGRCGADVGRGGVGQRRRDRVDGELEELVLTGPGEVAGGQLDVEGTNCVGCTADLAGFRVHDDALRQAGGVEGGRVLGTGNGEDVDAGALWVVTVTTAIYGGNLGFGEGFPIQPDVFDPAFVLVVPP